MLLLDRVTRLALAFALVAGLTTSLAADSLAQQATPVASPEAVEGVYADPEGRFTVPIPTNWTAETVEGYAVLTDPEGEITVYALAIPEADVGAAIAQAWQIVDPGVEREPIRELEFPPSAGIERELFVEYDDGIESGVIVQAVGRLVDGTTYVLLYDAGREVAARRASQIQIVDSGLRILSVEQVDLAGTAPLELTPELLAELETFIEEKMIEYAIPGVAVAVVQDGDVVYREGFGVRELGGDEPVTPETLMMIGSTTKSMTTMMMATLVDDGLMAWDTPVVEVLPSFAVADPALSAQITMRELVCACTGVPRRDFELVFNAADLEAEDVIASLADFVFFTPIGEAFQYSNQMVASGGYIATLAGGGSLGSLDDDYVTIMQDRIFDPIGMANSTFSFAEVEAEENHASSHARGLDGTLLVQPLTVEELLVPFGPAGSLWSNVDDLARYVITELNRGVAPNGDRVVSEENLGETWLPQVQVASETSYGLGWFVDSYKGQPMIHHGGNTLGFTSDLAFLPEAGLGIVTLTNVQGANVFTEAVRVRLLELAFDQAPEAEVMAAFGLELFDEFYGELAASVGPEPELADVEPYLGSHRNEALGDVTLEFVDGRLILDAGEFEAEVRTTAGEAARAAGFIMVDGPLASLLIDLRQDEAGRPALMILDPTSAGEYEFESVDAVATPVATPLP